MFRRAAPWPLALLLLATLAAGATLPADTTHVLELETGWDYAPVAGAVAPEALPVAWEPADLPHAGDLGRSGLYRIQFPVPALWHRERVCVVVRCREGTVRAWLNGQAAGVRRAGALDARFDVSDLFRRGELNTLLVAIETPAWLHRGALDACWIEATGPVRVRRLATAPEALAGTALVDVLLAVENRTDGQHESRLELALEPMVQPEGRHDVWRRHSDLRLAAGQVADVHHAFEIAAVQRWRFDRPALYRLTVVLRRRQGGEVLHTLVRHVGVRRVRAARGRWLVNDEWVRLGGIAFRVPGARLLCTWPGQAEAAARQCAWAYETDLPDLLDFCDRAGIGVLLDAPAYPVGDPGAAETLDALAALAWHPCVWGWAVTGASEAAAATAEALRERAPELPVGRWAPAGAEELAPFDFVANGFATEAVHRDDSEYGRRLDQAVRDARGRALALFDQVAPAAVGDRDSVAHSIPHRLREAARRTGVGALFFQVPVDTLLYPRLEPHFAPVWLKPPRHEGRRDRGALVMKTRFECGVESPVKDRLPAWALHGYRLCWRVGDGVEPLASGEVPVPVLRPRPLEGRGPEPLRSEAEWRLPKAGSVPFVVEVRGPDGHAVAYHRARLTVKVRPKGKVEVRVAAAPESVAEPPAPIRRRVVHVDLAAWFDNDAISTREKPKDGNFDLPNLPSGSTYPADALPAGGALLAPRATPGVTFRFPDTAPGESNNVRCNGQRIAVPEGRYAALWLLAAADTAHQKGTARLVYAGRQETVPVRVSDWCGEPAFGERVAVRSPERHTWDGQREPTACHLWAIPLPLRPEPLKAVVLPTEPKIHVFALSLVRTRRE